MYVSVTFFFNAEMMEWRIRAVFDLLFTMCHLIASISAYHTLLVPHIALKGERGRRKKVEEKDKNWRRRREGG